MKGQIFESPRGPVLIDAQTRDIVQDVYIRKVETQRRPALQRRVRRAVKAVKDPGKAEVSEPGVARRDATRRDRADADPPVRRHRLRHAAVRARRRPGGDARADELHQPRARRVRDGRRLRHGAADEPRRLAVPRLPAARLRGRRGCSARCSSARCTGRCTRKPHLDQVLFSIGLVFMAVAAVDYLVGSQQQNIQLPRLAAGPLRRSQASASASYRLFIIAVCAAAHASCCSAILSRTRFGSRLRAAVDDPRVAAGPRHRRQPRVPAAPSRSARASPGWAARSAPRCSGSIRPSRSSS